MICLSTLLSDIPIFVRTLIRDFSVQVPLPIGVLLRSPVLRPSEQVATQGQNKRHYEEAQPVPERTLADAGPPPSEDIAADRDDHDGQAYSDPEEGYAPVSDGPLVRINPKRLEESIPSDSLPRLRSSVHLRILRSHV